MLLLILFAFIAGIVTILSPCILPILPIILSSTIGDQQTSKSRPFGVVTGFVASFTFFTLFLSSLVNATNISADHLRLFSIIVIALLGLSLLIPQVQQLSEQLFARLGSRIPKTQSRPGFIGGILVGLSLGLLWTPCVGPILASVISLAITGQVTTQAFFITFAYALGTAIPMFAVMYGGRQLLTSHPWLLQNTQKIQQIFGIMMIITAIGIYFNIDRKFQTWILDTFPNYGTGLTAIEDVTPVQDQLDQLFNQTPQTSQPTQTSSLLSPQTQVAPEIIPGGQWYNTQPLTLQDLQGQVVLIDFWTYTCINCQRTFPYLRSWWDKYQDDGLIIIGVHAPEFEFEKDPNNLQEAIQDFDLTYPIVQDNDFRTWRAYNNRYWPAKYLIDKDGYIRYTHFGEGDYDQTEQAIQILLSEVSGTQVTESIDNPKYQLNSRTPETYLGYRRTKGLASPEPILEDQIQTFTLPTELRPNDFAYQGDWLITEEYAQATPGSSLTFNFESQDVFLVMNPVNQATQVKVSLDGQQVSNSQITDGLLMVDADALYHLIDLDSPGQHTLKLEFPEGNVQLFAFTFG